MFKFTIAIVLNISTNLIMLQIMRYILCYNNPILNLNPKTKGRRGLIIYNTTNGITTLKKHVNVDYSIKKLNLQKK
jgi:hypothetical protein